MFMIFCMGFIYCSGFTAFAAVDLDVTIIPPEEDVVNGQSFDLNLQIVTKSNNGYVDLEIKIEYNSQVFALAAPVNTNGYRVTGQKGQLTLTYFDPTGTNTMTEIGHEEIVPIKFIVMESAPEDTYKFKASVSHAYNNKGKNITWTPIYDKQVQVIRINNGVTSDDEVSSDDVSSSFVVGNLTTIDRTSAISGNGAKIASVLLGAIVVFAAGFVVGYILPMRKYEKLNVAVPSPTKRNVPNDYDDYDYGDYDEYDDYGESGDQRASDYGYDNDDGFYDRPEEDYSVPDDDYFSSLPHSEQSSGNYLDAFTSTSAANRTVSPIDFDSLLNPTEKNDNKNDDDEYPLLFMSRGSNGNSGQRRNSSPSFDEKSDTVFGRYSGNVERNIDDGYGSGFSSDRRSSHHDRPGNNRTRRGR